MNIIKTALIPVVLLAGCAQLSGVQITDAERKACEKQADCTIWTPQELENMARHFFGQGYKAGREIERKSL